MSNTWLKFEFQLPEDLVLELSGKHFSCAEHVSWQHIGIWPRLQFSVQRLMHRLRSTIIFPKMLSLKCQLKNSAEIYRILLLTHWYALLHNKNQCLSPTLGICLHSDFVSITRNVNFATPLLNKVYRLVIVFMGTGDALSSLIARQTGSRQWGPILISPFGEKWQF